VEPLIFTRISTVLRDTFSGILVTGEKLSAPSQWPAVSIVEMSNSTYTRSLDAEQREHHNNLYYEVEIFSNLSTGRKSQCRQIASVIREEFTKLNFTCSMLSPIPNAGSGIARYVGRFSGVVSEEGWLYRR